MRDGLGADAPDRHALAVQQHEQRGHEDALLREQHHGVRIVPGQDEEAGQHRYSVPVHLVVSLRRRPLAAAATYLVLPHVRRRCDEEARDTIDDGRAALEPFTRKEESTEKLVA